MPKVSVTIPTYNRAYLITDTIRSVLNQTFQDFEIVIVDDGSNDNTREVVESFNDPRIKYAYQDNQGVAGACKHCYAIATGDYICFLGSDDVLIEDSIEKRVAVLDKHPEVALVYGQAFLIDERGRPIGLLKQEYKKSYIREGIEDIKHLIMVGNHITGPAIMTRREYLNEIDIDTTLSSGSEDCDIWVRMAKDHHIAYIAEPVVKLRIHSMNITITRDLREEERSKLRILENIFSDLHLAPILSGYKQKAYYNIYVRLSIHAYGCGDMKGARKAMYKALKVYPRGIFTGLGFPWLYQIIKTLVPRSIIKIIGKSNRSN